ncbi:MAG: 50S ribosomal protein L4 [Chlamydiales bacterium]|nr:50S ribosomal protein L4 [Chlamydiales bacterium]
MANLKKYDLSGNEIGQLEISDNLLSGNPHRQMIKDYLVALMNNQRQWSANTKGRSEVNATSKKPHPQKGTGRARQGCLAAPQYRGGGVVFGPKPKSLSVRTRINIKEKRAAIRFLLAEKIKAGHLSILDPKGLESPKTKTIAKFLEMRELVKGRILFLGQMGEAEQVIIKSVSNIPKAYFGKAASTNGYDIVNSGHIVVMESAIDDLIKVLGEMQNEAE